MTTRNKSPAEGSQGMAENYFIPGTEPNPNNLHVYTATPIRQGCQLDPLIDGRDALTALEEAVCGACRNIHLALWLFDSETKLQSKMVKGKIKGLKTWADLLLYCANKG